MTMLSAIHQPAYRSARRWTYLLGFEHRPSRHAVRNLEYSYSLQATCQIGSHRSFLPFLYQRCLRPVGGNCPSRSSFKITGKQGAPSGWIDAPRSLLCGVVERRRVPRIGIGQQCIGQGANLLRGKRHSFERGLITCSPAHRRNSKNRLPRNSRSPAINRPSKRASSQTGASVKPGRALMPLPPACFPAVLSGNQK